MSRKLLGPLNIILSAIFLALPFNSFAALPFVTDDAAIADPNLLQLEAFTERWSLPARNNAKGTTLVGQYLGFSYGVNSKLEVSLGALAGYDFKKDKPSLMNPIVQMKSVVFKPAADEREIPTIALSLGYANRNGTGQYYDNVNNVYLLAIATSHFLNDNLLLHLNIGPKASYTIVGHSNVYRMQLGIAFDAAMWSKDFRFIGETYNGTPNSPRDSPGYFHSYQLGFRFLKSEDLAFHVLYGNQPTFIGYDSATAATYRRTSWVQFGIRKAFSDIF